MMSPRLCRKASLKRAERDAFAMNELSHQAGTGPAGTFHFIRTSSAPSGVPCAMLSPGTGKVGQATPDAGFSLLHVHPSLPLLEHALSCTEPASPVSLGPGRYQGCVSSTHPSTSAPGCRRLRGTPGSCKTLEPMTVTQVPRPPTPSLRHRQPLASTLSF